MPRSRNIKPGFFENEDLAECSPHARLLFVGLWQLADRRGILEDRPRRIAGAIFRYEQVDCDALLDELACRGFIERYASFGVRCIIVPNFVKHQNPHYKELPNELPAPDGFTDVVVAFGVSEAKRQEIFDRDGRACTRCGSADRLSLDHIMPRSLGGSDDDDNLTTLCLRCNSSKNNRVASEQRRVEVGSTSVDDPPASHAETLLPLTESPIPHTETKETADAESFPLEFLEFWNRYPKGNGSRPKSLAAWKKVRKEHAAIMAGLESWHRSERWQKGMVKAAELWLRDRLWENPPLPPKANGNGPERNGQRGMTPAEILAYGRGEYGEQNRNRDDVIDARGHLVQ